jgi:hypothetical protein
MSGCCSTMSDGRSAANCRLFTKPRPLTLGLNSVHPRSAQMTVDHRFAGSDAPVPRVYESP